MAVRPHPLLQRYYGSEQERLAYIRALFNRVAPEYDRVNRILSLGFGRWYRRMMLKRAGLRAGMRVLDIAVGTGLVAREELRIVGATGKVIGLDLSENMLKRAQRMRGIQCVQACAEALPIESSSMDFLSMGYALRHVTDLVSAFNEFCRVLRPSGTLVLLEFGQPDGRIANLLAALYIRQLVPALCQLRGQGEARELLSYCWDTVENCVSEAIIRSALVKAGFADITCDVSVGVFRAYFARRPARV
jgi:demethylmenaquinone methyltransferase/2-methoxy-6-polyprenyl-1,4-benzoquinol methylase